MFDFEIECVAFYAVTWVAIIARTVSRITLRKSLKRLEIDDYLIIFAVLCHTITVAMLLWTWNVDANFLSVTDIDFLDPVAIAALTPDDYENIVLGFKLALVVEQTQIITIWSVKVCLLMQYARLTYVLHQNLFTKIVGVFTAVGFIVMEILFFGAWCKPISQYWQVPVQNEQCLTYYNHMIVFAVANLSSDIMILILPFPILWYLPKMPIAKKIGLAIIFALGLFTIVSAALSKYYTLSNPGTIEWFFWYNRESSTALIVASLPQTWTLIQRIVPSFRDKDCTPEGIPKSTGLSTNESHGSRGEGNDHSPPSWSNAQDHINSESSAAPGFQEEKSLC